MHVAMSDGKSSYFVITVVDEESGRGIPLVQLTTVNKIQFWTDSNGVIAFDEPGMMTGGEVWFTVFSHGYEIAKDWLGFPGLQLKPQPGAEAKITLKRINIAQRLYRITGQGIYRDSVLVGRATPLQQPLINGLVVGQDTTNAVIYRNKIYWFWGDTERVSYPLGHFAVSDATSELPTSGGLNPDVGIDLTYFKDETGFSKPMCATLGEGLHWVESVMPVKDEKGAERLVARVSSQKGFSPSYAWHLALFDDEKQIFESIVRWELSEWHDASHPFRVQIEGTEYIYLYPNLRVRANLKSLSDLAQYEAFTCLMGSEIDRDDKGIARWGWKVGANRVDAAKLKQLLVQGLKPDESWVQLRDFDSGALVEAGRGSVAWNSYRNRWTWIFSANQGDVWFAEADSPVGPWLFARRIVQHDKYNFYNPVQHTFFNQEKGKIIYFEGTYTSSFSDAKEKTPRYDYNQIMYQVLLDDPRLILPVPIYFLKTGAHSLGPVLSEHCASLPFFALPKSHAGAIPIYQGSKCLTVSPEADAVPLFFAVPAEDEKAIHTVPLYEYVQEGVYSYSTDSNLASAGTLSAKPLCRVWTNPMKVLLLEPFPTVPY